MSKIALAIAMTIALCACNGGDSQPRPRPTAFPTQQPTSQPTAQPTATPTATPEPERIHLTAQRIIKSGETLTLKRAMYSSSLPGPSFLMEADSTLDCDGSVLLESTAKDVWTVIQDLASSRDNGRPTHGLTVRNCVIVGNRNDFNSGPQAISLGNCDGCLIEGNRLENTHSIGVQFGGSDQYGFYAKNFKILRNVFIGVASQNIAVTNGENFEIAYNEIYAPGQRGGPGTTSIDLEVNGGEDRLINGHIHHNLIDHRNSVMDTTGNGIVVNNGNSSLIGNILIEENTIIGGSVTHPVTNKLSNGVYVFGVGSTARGVTIRKNRIQRTGQSCIRVEGRELLVENNSCDSVGGGGVLGFVALIHDSTVTGNSLVCTGDPCDGSLLLVGIGNRVENNAGWTVISQ